MPNHLIHTTSPYLLQHADNPVDWYPWDAEALGRARTEDKPIFLSIGYAACHWCHVMAHESFEDLATAAYMNTHFVNIKVDREERPDLDGIYMQAVVALTGQGGWPMSVFLTPDGVPFYGGTYYPPARRYNMPAFIEVLQAVAHAWESDRQNVLDAGRNILDHLHAQADTLVGARHAVPLREILDSAASTLVGSYNWAHGGWGRAPKFPQPMALEFLLRIAARSLGENAGNAAPVPSTSSPLGMVVHALGVMAKGGMYDVVGGGFARYATDDLWLIPHFEKMLYDNAQLARVYLHAYLVCRGTESKPPSPFPAFRRVCEETLDFVLREMTHPQGGFYSSLDADSEGEEGKFYIWTVDEICAALGDAQDVAFIVAAYGVTSQGNFEGKNILQRALSDDQLAERFGMPVAGVPERLCGLHARLLAARSQRIRPGTDDKVLVSWNALMLAAFAEAGRYLDRPDYLSAAQRNARFILENMVVDGRLIRSWRIPSPKCDLHLGEGRGGGGGAFLEDYAALILGLLALYQSDSDATWYAQAFHLAEEMVAHYTDIVGGFFDTRDDAEALILRPKDLQDNATPSGSALAACALLQLAAYEGRSKWRDQAEAMLADTQEAMARYPTAFAQWLQAVDFAQGPVHEVAIVGDADQPLTQALHQVVWARYRPRLVVAFSAFPPPPGSPALLKARPLLGGQPTAYVCQGFVCRMPVSSAQELEAQLDGDSSCCSSCCS